MNNETLQLLARAEKGDQTAFKAVVKAYMPRLYGLVYSMVHSHDETHDILQEVFIKVFRSLHQLENKKAFKSWVCRIAVNTTRNRLTSKFRRETPTEPTDYKITSISQEGDISTPLEQADIKTLIHQAIETLSPDHRSVVTLVEIEEMSCAEAAKVLNCPPGTVRSRLHYAKKKLLEHLAPYRSYLTGEAS